MSLSRDILALCRDLGFAAAGICRAEPTRWREELNAWLADGKHGSMDYLREQLDARLDPQLLLPGVRSIIMVADLYAARGVGADPPTPDLHGRIARYARGRDYHEVVKRRLHHLADTLRARFPAPAPGPEPLQRRFRSFVDTAPVLEREYAARAGLGWVGKHTLLIHPRLGSYMLLGGIATTLDLEPPEDQDAFPDHCGTCTRCIDACPTRAITPYSVDATRCISYLTIENRETIDPALHPAIGDWLYGCDICQEVCPHNSPRPAISGAAAVGEINPAYAPRRMSFDLLEVLAWSEDDRRTAFTSSSMKRAGLALMKRNALIALGNAIGASMPRVSPPPPSPTGEVQRVCPAMRVRGAGGSGVPPATPSPLKPSLSESASEGSDPSRHSRLGAAHTTTLLARLRQVSEDASEPELVRLTARQVLDRLDPPHPPPARLAE